MKVEEYLCIHLLVQGFVLQGFVIINEAGLAQGFPPYLGTGFEHDLTRIEMPPPQVALQGNHVPQALQLPSTEIFIDVIPKMLVTLAI